MEVSSPKRKKEEIEVEKEDLISQLPDEILQHIISLIDIEEAVETSLLSKRWKNLWWIWFSLSNLDFNISRLAFRRRVNLKDSKASQDFFHRFAQFVDHFLSRRDHNSTLREFHLSLDCASRDVFGEEPHAAFVEKCVDYAINHGVQVLHLHGLCGPALRLPDAFSACKTLHELKLRPFVNDVHIPKWFSSSHLKTLYLENTDFMIGEHEYFVFLYSVWVQPFSRFPELEKLTLHDCRSYELLIDCPKLRYHEIINNNEKMVRVTEICTPELTCFRYQGSKPLQCEYADFPMLEEAYLNINHRYGILIKGKMTTWKCMWLLEQLRYDRILALSFRSVGVKGRVTIGRSLKLMEGRKRLREFPTVQQRVMFQRHLKEGCSVAVELPEGVSVVDVEDISKYINDDADLRLQLVRLFQIHDIYMD